MTWISGWAPAWACGTAHNPAPENPVQEKPVKHYSAPEVEERRAHAYEGEGIGRRCARMPALRVSRVRARRARGLGRRAHAPGWGAPVLPCGVLPRLT
jgi:hypothetical protein